jgi:SAM-dependent methyltransferase
MRSWREAAFAVLWRAARLLELASRAVIYIASGVLHRDSLQRAVVKSWDGFSRTDAAILSGLMPWEQAWYDRVLKPDDHVLLVGCGSGRDLVALLELGFRVDGLDPSESAIELARRTLQRRGLSANLYTGAIEETVLPGTFDAVIFSWFAYGYIPGRAARIGALRRIIPRLKPGGRVLISYIPAETPPRALPIALTRFAARLTKSDWGPERGDILGFAGGDRHALHYEHDFFPDELEGEAKTAGLTVVAHEQRDVGMAVLRV